MFLWSLCYIILFHEFLFCASLASISACSKIAILYGQLRRFLGHWVCMKRRHQSHTTKNTFWSVPSSSYRLQCLIICFCSMCPLRQGIQDLQNGVLWWKAATRKNKTWPVGVPTMLPNAKLFHHPRKVNVDQLWLTARRDRPVSTRVSTIFCKRN